ncbi:MAG: ATP-dependent DNA helicase RecG [Lachnospiraceae bacterium]|mgnify:FL=1|nr:ATP-dependent DNA helicase RecG [Lachnospiraceae bacterium]
MTNLDAPIDSLKGIGAKTKQTFEKAGIETLEDLIHYYPREYERYEAPVPVMELKEGMYAAVSGRLLAPLQTRYVRGLSITSGLFGDGLESILVSWFNMPYLKNSLRSGVPYIFRGRIKAKGDRLILEQPAVFKPEQYQAVLGTMLPVYTLVKGMTNQMVTKAIRQVLEHRGLLAEHLPEAIRERYQIAEYNFSLEQIHFPKSEEGLREARKRLVFDEFFFFLLQLRGLKDARQKEQNQFEIREMPEPETLIQSLPYSLTGAQKRVWETIREELQQNTVMARLIQGDVGSGKTIVSILAMVMTAANGLQSALMVPTEVLARQHYASFQELMEKNGFAFQAVLLTGSMTAKQKREAYAKIESGEVSVIIGTHALIQEKVNYHSLALVITDEQHRFGVRQREMLSEKGIFPHTIVMSATPIPRTLAVILYGDLDISVINEMPANRLPIKNCVVDVSYRKKAYEFIRKEVEAGHQAYVICPMVEESEAMDAENVVEYTEVLRTELPPSFCIEYLHGKMKPKEKNEIMERFLANEIQVLVSTTVIEVGVNVPNATVMMVENSERFGLAQLHQLRGRVGRGGAQSYCIFLHKLDGKQIRERLDILCKSNDGFEIANRDMQLRGPGDLFGVRQSGMLDFALADIYSDADTLQQANEAIGKLLKEDPKLQREENASLKRRYEQLLQRQKGRISL